MSSKGGSCKVHIQDVKASLLNRSIGKSLRDHVKLVMQPGEGSRYTLAFTQMQKYHKVVHNKSLV